MTLSSSKGFPYATPFTPPVLCEVHIIAPIYSDGETEIRRAELTALRLTDYLPVISPQTALSPGPAPQP